LKGVAQVEAQTGKKKRGKNRKEEAEKYLHHPTPLLLLSLILLCFLRRLKGVARMKLKV